MATLAVYKDKYAAYEINKKNCFYIKKTVQGCPHKFEQKEPLSVYTTKLKIENVMFLIFRYTYRYD